MLGSEQNRSNPILNSAVYVLDCGTYEKEVEKYASMKKPHFDHVEAESSMKFSSSTEAGT